MQPTALIPHLSSLFRNGSDESLATAMTLLLQRPDAHLPLMTSGDARVCLPAIGATIDLFESLGPGTREQLRTFDIAHLEELQPSFPGKVAGALERLSQPPVVHHDALASLARQRQSEGGYAAAISYYRKAMEVPHADNDVDRLFHATAIFRTTTSAEQRAEVFEELRDVRDALWERGVESAQGFAYAALAEWATADVYVLDGGALSASGCEGAARIALEDLCRSSGHVGALHRMATRALRAGLWCFGLLEHAARLDEGALKPMVVRIMNDECLRALRLGNPVNAIKVHFEMALSAHARGNLSVALKRYGEAYASLSRESRKAKEWKRTIAVLMAVCEGERDGGVSDGLISRVKDQGKTLKGDPEHAALLRWMSAIANRLRERRDK